MGDKYELLLAPRSQILRTFARNFCRRALGYLRSARSEKKNGKKKSVFLRKRLAIIDLFEGLVGGGTLSPLAPVLGPEPFFFLAMSPSPTVHGGQYDTKYVTFEYLLHAAFVGERISVV